jgi:hypothetical protein
VLPIVDYQQIAALLLKQILFTWHATTRGLDIIAIEKILKLRPNMVFDKGIEGWQRL